MDGGSGLLDLELELDSCLLRDGEETIPAPGAASSAMPAGSSWSCGLCLGVSGSGKDNSGGGDGGGVG